MNTEKQENIRPASSARNLLTRLAVSPARINQTATNTPMSNKYISAILGMVSWVVLIICQTGQAQVSVPTLVQFAYQNNGPNDLPYSVATFPSNNTAGDLIVVGVTVGGATAEKPATVTDTQGNVYYPATSQMDFSTGGGNASYQLFYAPNIRGGPNTVTMTERDSSTGGGNAYNAIAIHEYSGVSIASPLDVSAAGVGITTNSPFTITSPLANTTVDGDLIFGYGNVINGPVSAGPGFTYYQSTAGITEDLVQPTAGSIAATAIDSTYNDPYGMSMAAFKPLSGSLSGPVLPLQGSQAVGALSTLVVTNTAAVVNTNQMTTNTIVFNYADRNALTNDGWNFIATNPDGSPRNTETNPAVLYNPLPGSLGVPCDVGDLFGTDYNNTRNSLFRSLPTNWASLRVKLSLDPTVDVDQAHLTVYQDDDNYLEVGLAYNTGLGGEVVTMVTETNGVATHFWTIVFWYEGGPGSPAVTNIFLRLDKIPNTSDINGFASLDGSTWALIGRFSQGLLNPRLALWASSTSVPYTNGISPICYWQQLDTLQVAPGPALTYQLVNPPAGASIDTNGIITWTPTALQAASNYVFKTIVTENSLTATNSFNVTVRTPLTVTNLLALNKVYDGTANATLNATNAGLSGVLNGDDVTLVTSNAVAYFADSNVGTGIGVTVSGLTLAGTAAGNYTLTQPSGLTANITALGVTITSGIAANSKPYDGTTAGTISSNNVVLNGVLAGDAANVWLNTNGYTANFTSAGAGTGIGVTVSGLTLAGTAAGNYTLTQPSGLTANITALGVTITSGLSANSKPYDGTTAATISSNNVVLNGVLAGDTANVRLNTNGYTANFTSAAAGTGIGVTVSGLTLAGTAA
ncbi:MAG: YDG domain-containing protein, partial [Verrucomicrobiota bacterium]